MSTRPRSTASVRRSPGHSCCGWWTSPTIDHRRDAHYPIEHLYDTFGRQINTILDQLVAARLVVAHDQFVDLAHEALITEWPRLAEWIDQDRDRLRAMVQLSHAATEWDTGGRSSTDLYRGVRLDAACTLLDRGDPVTPGERAFVEASMART